MNDFITLKKAAEIRGCSTQWLRYMCSHGKIPGAQKLDGLIWLIPYSYLEPWLPVS
jgi:hypothetical protein